MSGSTPRDESETEPLSPARTLLDWRDTRDVDRYRDWCLDRFGGFVEVGDYKFHPASVLTLKDGATEKARAHCRSQLELEDKETICEQYPAPVAVPYHQFLNGSRQPMHRLTRMRDTWEGLIHLLSALAIAEASRIGVGSGQVMIVERGSRRPARARDLRSDRLSGRLGLLEGILESWRESGVRAAIAEIVSPGVVAELRRLNSVRNGFSHLGTLSDTQARELVDGTAPVLRDSLVDLLPLAGVQLVRLTRVAPGAPPSAEVESLNGHARSRRVFDLPLDADSESLVLRAGRIERYDRVLAKMGARIVDLAPYFYACDDSSGHQTRVCFYKKRNERQVNFEVVGDAVEITSDATPHDPEFSRCQSAVVGDSRATDDD